MAQRSERAHVASPLPPLLKTEPLTASQWDTLMAIGETIIPAIEPSPKASRGKLSIDSSEYASIAGSLKSMASSECDLAVITTFLDESPSTHPDSRELLHRLLSEHIPSDARRGMAILLSALNTRAGCLITTGTTTPFHLLPIHTRQTILQSWQHSYLPPLKQSAKALTTLFKLVWLRTSPTIGKVLGFPKVPVHGKPSTSFDYDFLQFPLDHAPEEIETDVIIVGSGCGGGVCAKNLAEAGHRVLVVDKAYHFSSEHFPMAEKDAGMHLFMSGGSFMSDDSSISIIAGQAWGGGGTVNWSASLQTQGFVRQEWADQGLPFFLSSEFQTSLDRVCDRMGVSADHIEHNKTNQVLLEGARKLGYNAKAVPQNTAGQKHYCGYCTLGCRSCEKQGPVVSFLPDAHAAGATFIEGYDVESVIFGCIDGQQVATGVRGKWRSRDVHGATPACDAITRDVVIKAKRVIISSGTMSSPLLLLRSGLTNPQIGRNLHLHPANIFTANFSEPTNPWEGGILTAVVDSFQNLDSACHGVKLEAMTMIPSFVLPLLPWSSGPDFKLLAASMRNMTGFISLARDSQTGRVYPDPVDGRCRVAYTPSALDRRHCLTGLEALAKIAYVAGASSLLTTTAGVPAFQCAAKAPGSPDITDSAFQEWLAIVNAKGLPIPDASFGSAHQMGTCRMSNSARTGVVNPQGKVWGVEALYVADASVFPSASGVNPMVTNMAISDWISRGISRELKTVARMKTRL